MTKKITVTQSSGNVFADLGVQQPDEALAKAALAHKIADIISRGGMTQARAAKLLGIDQPKVSALIRGRLRGFSAERLMKLLTALGRDVEIVVKRHRRKTSNGEKSLGRITVL